MALKLIRNGISRVRPLHGGLNLWMERQYPVSAFAREAPISKPD